MKEQEAQRWKKIAIALYGLLDDIDTAEDMAKDDDFVYRSLVHRYHNRRHKFLTSDGYELYFPEDLEQRQTKDLLNQLRNVDCVEIQTCFKGHGTAWFVYLGDGEKKRIVGNGNSLEEALVDSVRKEFHTGSDNVPAAAIIDNAAPRKEWPIMITIGETFIGGHNYIEITPGGVIVDGVKELDISEVMHWHYCIQQNDVSVEKGVIYQGYGPNVKDGNIFFMRIVPEVNDEEQSNSSG